MGKHVIELADFVYICQHLHQSPLILMWVSLMWWFSKLLWRIVLIVIRFVTTK